MSKIFSSKLKTLLIIIGIVVVLLTAVMFFYLTGIGAVDSKSDKDVSVTIPQGSGAAAIVKILDEEGTGERHPLRQNPRQNRRV